MTSSLWMGPLILLLSIAFAKSEQQNYDVTKFLKITILSSFFTWKHVMFKFRITLLRVMVLYYVLRYLILSFTGERILDNIEYISYSTNFRLIRFLFFYVEIVTCISWWADNYWICWWYISLIYHWLFQFFVGYTYTLVYTVSRIYSRIFI